MADPLILRRRVSESTFALSLVLYGVVPADETESVVGEVNWRWEDEPDMKPEYLGRAVAGNSLRIPFDPKGRDVHLYLVSRTADGRSSVANIFDSEQTVFSSPARAFSGEVDIEAGEDLAAFDLINMYNDGGTPKARKADATDNTRPAGAFVVEAASGGGSLVGGSQVRLFFGGNIITTSGRTPGAVQYLSETAGGMTETAPTGAGKVVQVIGRAISATKVIFEPSEPAVLT